MKTEITKNGLRKITADEGLYLTQAKEVEVRVFSKVVYLGKGDEVENWREATEEEKLQHNAKVEEELANSNNLVYEEVVE